MEAMRIGYVHIVYLARVSPQCLCVWVRLHASLLRETHVLEIRLGIGNSTSVHTQSQVYYSLPSIKLSNIKRSLWTNSQNSIKELL
jgi:hypothetical protein